MAESNCRRKPESGRPEEEGGRSVAAVLPGGSGGPIKLPDSRPTESRQVPEKISLWTPASFIGPTNARSQAAASLSKVSTFRSKSLATFNASEFPYGVKKLVILS
jgi:hypothetical protein